MKEAAGCQHPIMPMNPAIAAKTAWVFVWFTCVNVYHLMMSVAAGLNMAIRAAVASINI